MSDTKGSFKWISLEISQNYYQLTCYKHSLKHALPYKHILCFILYHYLISIVNLHIYLFDKQLQTNELYLIKTRNGKQQVFMNYKLGGRYQGFHR